MSQRMRSILKQLDAKVVDAFDFTASAPARILNGWELKAYSILHCSFKEVLLLDADNVPLVDPAFLFETAEFKETGAICWPDRWPMSQPGMWEMCGLPEKISLESEFESGQLLVNKHRCWRVLRLAMWMNEYSDFFYRYMHGDKETFHVAFKKLKKSYSMTSTPVKELEHTLCQHDFKGKRIFQHRIGDKWVLFGQNACIDGFQMESECKKYVAELRASWDGVIANIPKFGVERTSEEELIAAESLIGKTYEYHRIGFDRRNITFAKDGVIGAGQDAMEVFWDVLTEPDGIVLVISSQSEQTCIFKRDAKGTWQGRWLKYERMFVELKLVHPPIRRGRVAAVNGTDSRRIPTGSLLLRAPVNFFSGYGLHACRMAMDLKKFGYDVRIVPTAVDESVVAIPRSIKKILVDESTTGTWELLLHPPSLAPTSSRKVGWFTMWETTALSPLHVERLNRAEFVIVPTSWNATSFLTCGVKCPIRIVPLGIDIDLFKPSKMSMTGTCVFGAAARHDSGRARKRLDQVVSAFLTAFPKERDVELQVKCFADCNMQPVDDPRVKIIARYMQGGELAAWFKEITCFVSASRGEGWGLMQHQALATGRPIIACRFGGVAEFFDHTMGYPLDFRLAPAEGSFTDCGFWAEPDEGHLVSLMRRVYRDRRQARELGAAGAAAVRHFSWRKSHRKLEAVLQEFCLLS